ncbi:DUF2284 domain-containing protein [Desulfobacterales bacterium HSG17]|nr:DUF2284 domain-containing protein [Desulfobacterales bacterium HSG17]
MNNSEYSKDSGQTHESGITDKNLEKLINIAQESGAASAAVISAQDIKVQNELANMCKEPRCENYGLSASCPPFVSGPSGFREMQKKMKHAIVVKIDVPLETLMSDQGQEIMKLLHETVANVENSAVEMGYANSKAFAGGSCKKLFCHDYADCRVVSKKGRCRNPKSARQSMSGFGINVSEMIVTAGWSGKSYVRDRETDADSMSWIAGVILVG